MVREGGGSLFKSNTGSLLKAQKSFINLSANTHHDKHKIRIAGKAHGNAGPPSRLAAPGTGDGAGRRGRGAQIFGAPTAGTEPQCQQRGELPHPHPCLALAGTTPPRAARTGDHGAPLRPVQPRRLHGTHGGYMQKMSQARCWDLPSFILFSLQTRRKPWKIPPCALQGSRNPGT